MRVIVTGASGNLGTSLLGVLGNNKDVDEIIGVARRPTSLQLPKVRWEQADVATSDLSDTFAGADAVVHLAWEVRPSHRTDVLHAVNVEGSRRVFEAAVTAGAKTVVHLSSVGVYSPGPKEPVDEGHPNNGVSTSSYALHKAAVERIIDDMEAEQPDTRWVRLRPGLIFKRESAEHIRRLFFGSLYPIILLRRRPLPVFPDVPGLIVNAVHASDVARAIEAALTRDVRGAFNLAAEPPLDVNRMAEIAQGFTIPLPKPNAALRAAAHVTWRAHLQPTEPGWIDLALQTPLLDSSRARAELGWDPKVSAEAAFAELIEGLRDGAHFATPPLERAKRMPVRTGVQSGLALLRQRFKPAS
jgi:UDP-glucose 4-epimerase